MLRFNNLVMAVGFIVLAGLCLYLRRVKGKEYQYLTLLSIFFVYIMYVFRFTLFPIPFSVEQAFQFNANLVPFRLDPYTRLLGREVLLNILLSVPLGFGLPFLFRVRLKEALVAGVGFGLVVETSQLLISLGIGYAYRVFDVNDLIFNFTGVMLGYGGFLLFAQAVLQLSRRWEFLRSSGLVSYLGLAEGVRVRDVA
jgi:glycopeptide antibiotics resistance protein